MRAPAKNVLFSLLSHVSDFRTDYLCHEMRRKVNIGILRILCIVVYSSVDGRSSKKQTYPVKTRKYGKKLSLFISHKRDQSCVQKVFT